MSRPSAPLLSSAVAAAKGLSKHGALDTETQYFFENGFRKVQPYVFEIKSHAKERWFNRSLVEVFLAEFPAVSASYYTQAILSGRVTVNSKPADLNTVIQQGDVLGHVIVRHEPPVLADRVEVIAEASDHVAVNKPASMPVHPTGRYRHNTLTTILRREHGIKELFPIHRLDIMTSGLVIFGKTSAASKRFQDLMKRKEVRKEYLCRVLGEFPRGDVVCTEPLDSESLHLGVTLVSQAGKPSMTEFQRINTDGKTSLVRCVPITGRTHQIRVHLQYLGHPIVNDSLYANPVFGPNLGKGGLTTAEKALLKERLLKLRPKAKEDLINPMNLTKPSIEGEGEVTVDEPDRNLACLWLHARRYSGPGFDYSTSLPSWADPSFSAEPLLQSLIPTENTLPWAFDRAMVLNPTRE